MCRADAAAEDAAATCSTVNSSAHAVPVDPGQPVSAGGAGSRGCRWGGAGLYTRTNTHAFALTCCAHVAPPLLAICRLPAQTSPLARTAHSFATHAPPPSAQRLLPCAPLLRDRGLPRFSAHPLTRIPPSPPAQRLLHCASRVRARGCAGGPLPAARPGGGHCGGGLGPALRLRHLSPAVPHRRAPHGGYVHGAAQALVDGRGPPSVTEVPCTHGRSVGMPMCLAVALSALRLPRAFF